jgi:plastocyanin
MKKLLALAVAGTVATACAVPALAGTKSVTVGDDYFVKRGAESTVSIHKNSSVKWVWKGKHKHNVFEISGPVHFHSPSQKQGTFTHKFKKTGTYEFVCTYHANMKMKVKVK